jgi:2-phospho-L-lactate guanylyltransferase
MQAALLPVKSLASAKGRLGATLSAAEREALTRAMLADMVDALAATPGLDRTYVLSADAEVLHAAATLGATPLAEDRTQSDPVQSPRTQSDPGQWPRTQSRPGPSPAAVGGLNRAVASAAAHLAAAGVTRLLTIPGDVPLIEPDEVAAAFAVDAAVWPVVLIPSGDGCGTNGLLLSPPTAIVPRFEGASLAAHIDACRELGIAFHVLALASFALDVDTPEDLAELARRGNGRRSGRVVAAKRTAA